MQIKRKILYLFLILALVFNQGTLQAQTEIKLSAGINNTNYFEVDMFHIGSSQEYFVAKNSYVIRLQYLKSKDNGNKQGFMLEYIHKKAFSDVFYLKTHVISEFQTMDWSMQFINLHYVFDKHIYANDYLRLSLPVEPYIGGMIYYCLNGEQGQIEPTSSSIENINECTYADKWLPCIGISSGLSLQYQLCDSFEISLSTIVEVDPGSYIKNSDWTMTRSFLITLGVAYRFKEKY